VCAAGQAWVRRTAVLGQAEAASTGCDTSTGGPLRLDSGGTVSWESWVPESALLCAWAACGMDRYRRPKRPGEDHRMYFEQFDRTRLHFKPLRMREDKIFIERERVLPREGPSPLPQDTQCILDETVRWLTRARDLGRSRMLVFGAHVIKNGLAPVVISLMERGWITHVATNGAGVIHDWEFAYQGHSSEDVRKNVARGEFGIWEETGFYLNLATLVGAYEGRGYGESVAALIEHDGLNIPAQKALGEAIDSRPGGDCEQAASAADLLGAVRAFDLRPGWLTVLHPFKKYSLNAAAFRLGVPFTCHPMIGHDIIYTHPMNSCAAIGRAAQRDFLAFAHAVSNLDEGVYISIGSAVMSPMIFEKSFSMAQNLAIQRNERIDKHFIVVVDIAPANWDWACGEPPGDSPDFYVRYNKTFSRMGGTMRYVCADNCAFLPALASSLGQ